MIITFPDGTQKEFDDGMTGVQIAATISPGLARATLSCSLDGVNSDAFLPITGDHTIEFHTFNDANGRFAYRHTASHIMAQAVKRLFPDTKLAIGPAIENGFYYDFDTSVTFSPDDLANIEAEMRKICKENIPLERFELPRDEAIAFVSEADETYKAELIHDLPTDAKISFYKQGDFVDLCAGPHLASTGMVKHFKLMSVAGAYWRGDEKNKMLKRVYGTAFDKKADMDAYLEMLAEAKRRDHNKLGRELAFFTTADIIGQGLPILLPKGATVIRLLQRFVEDEEQKRGWLPTKTPFLAKSALYKLSGHWDHYLDDMFVFGDDTKGEGAFALRPMTCPFQYQAYLNKARSYRDLPLRYNETSTLFRNEASGEMHGLIRVRQFTISEGHLMCTDEQLADEFKKCLELNIFMLKTLGLYEDVSYRFSQWDPNNRSKYIGSDEVWNETQEIMHDILTELKLPYYIGVDEAAFYGPKLDIQIKNVFGKEDTLLTVQIDRLLAERFGMEYTDKDGKKKNPCIIHRTSIGCYERTLALLIEKYAGAFPVWLAPTQVILLPIADRHLDHIRGLAEKLSEIGIRCEVDDRSEKIGYKIRSAQLEKIPYMLVVGDNDIANNTISVRSRKAGDEGAFSLDAFMNRILSEIARKVID